MKNSKKKIGTIMGERLFYEAKKAALEKAIPFHRFVEEAVEKHVRESSPGSRKPNPRPSARITEKSPSYHIENGGAEPSGAPPSFGDFDPAPNPAAPYSVSLEERWKRVLLTAGKYHSGRTDVSLRHDDFAFEAFKE